MLLKKLKTWILHIVRRSKKPNWCTIKGKCKTLKCLNPDDDYCYYAERLATWVCAPSQLRTEVETKY